MSTSTLQTRFETAKNERKRMEMMANVEKIYKENETLKKLFDENKKTLEKVQKIIKEFKGVSEKYGVSLNSKKKKTGGSYMTPAVKEEMEAIRRQRNMRMDYAGLLKKNEKLENENRKLREIFEKLKNLFNEK
jgi:hypothetical protein